MAHAVRDAAKVLALCLLGFGGVSSNYVYADCFDHSAFVNHPVALKKGLGIKRVEFKLYRADNSLFRLYISNGKVSEKCEVLLENQAFKVCEPKDPSLQDGSGGIVNFLGQSKRCLERIQENRFSPARHLS